jgi:MoaA/NifB/PqqE/SkfB family radical SAM enzyme
MLSITQFLIFELGTTCNLSGEHKKCPILKMKRKRTVLDDRMILSLAEMAYGDLDFSGWVGWHYYNEPMLSYYRMIGLMKEIKKRVAKARFALWTNGTLEERWKIGDLEMFDAVFVSDYSKKGNDYYREFYGDRLRIVRSFFDKRVVHEGEGSYERCLRPFVDFVVDNSGDVHLCCQDWRGEIEIGNVYESSLGELNERRNGVIRTILNGMDDKFSPPSCISCNGRCTKYPVLLGEVYKKAVRQLSG